MCVYMCVYIHIYVMYVCICIYIYIYIVLDVYLCIARNHSLMYYVCY